MGNMKYDDLEVIKIAVNPLYPRLAIYLYFIDGLLIDTGPRLRSLKLKRMFRSWDIQQVAITHHHEDHMGMVPWLATHKSLPIYCHESMIPWIEEKQYSPRYLRSEEHTSELQSRGHLVCRLLLEKQKQKQ